MILDQTRHMAGGDTHPRLVAKDVDALWIPIPDDETQRQFAEEAARRRAEARPLKADAKTTWPAAKHRFGHSLIRAAG